MTRLRAFLFRLRGLFLKRKLEAELAEEIQSHLEMQVEEHLRQGITPEETRYLALRKFGGVEQVKETYREQRSLQGVETFFRDLRYGFRMLRRSPGMTAVAIVSLALGIGANTALFSAVYAILIKPLPVEEPERLVLFDWQAGRPFRTSGMSGTSNVEVPPGKNLARAAFRASEIKVRLAVGAGRWRLLRQLLTESLLLATLGGLFGVLVAYWCKGALSTLADKQTGLLPSGVELNVNWTVLGFTLAVSLLTGVLFGLAPAWRATSLDLSTALKRSGRTTTGVSRLSKALLVAQVTVSALLLTGAGLFIRTLYNLQRVELGFNPENLLVFRLQPEQAGYKDERLLRLYQQIFDRLDHLPGVRAATFARIELLADDNWFNDFLLPGEAPATAPEHETMRQIVRENYFAAMEIPLVQGREFTAQDDHHAAAVAVINQTFMRKFFPDGDGLGKRIRFNDREVEIVGVVRDTKYRKQREELQPLLYTPWQQEAADIGEMHFALRTAGDSNTLSAQAREVVHHVDSSLPVSEIGTQSARAQTTLAEERLYARLFGFFGAVALALAGVGLFGVLAYSVSERTKEIGVRMAFGAPATNVVVLVIWQGMKLVLLGLAVGSLIGYVFVRLLNSQYFGPDTWQQEMLAQLYGVTVSDPLTLIVGASLLTLVALLACWLPARRAAKVDPLIALRYE